jgi:SAM-dependent methyltransferase
MDRPNWAPKGVDIDRPSAARVYDYLLGGSHNFAVDRESAHQLLAVMPDAGVGAQAIRAFQYRAMRYLLDSGVRQFLDIGAGVPTVGSVHEVAQRFDPQSRVVYVDIDPIAVAHSRAILAGNEHAAVIQEDLRRPDAILEHCDVRGQLDFSRPVAVLVVAILHAIPDTDDPHRIIGRLRDALAPGSHLLVSHPSFDGIPEVWQRFAQVAADGGYPITPRPRAEVERFFTGFELVEPGVVWVPQWRPEDPGDVGEQPERTAYGGVGRKP